MPIVPNAARPPSMNPVNIFAGARVLMLLRGSPPGKFALPPGFCIAGILVKFFFPFQRRVKGSVRAAAARRAIKGFKGDVHWIPGMAVPVSKKPMDVENAPHLKGAAEAAAFMSSLKRAAYPGRLIRFLVKHEAAPDLFAI